MPKIPTGQEQLRMNPSSPVSIADTNDARLVGNAVSKLGGAVGDYGAQLGRIENVERDIKAQEKKNILDAEGAAALEEAKRSGEKDIPKAFERIYGERTSKILENDPDAKSDPILYSRMTDTAGQISQVGQIHAQTEMLRAGEERVLNAFKETTNSYRKSVAQTPDAAVSMFKDFKINVLDKAADVAGVSAVRRSDMEYAARADFAEATIDGYMSQKKFGKALRLLNAKTTGTVELNGMQVPIEMQDSSGKPLSPEEVSFMSALSPEKRDQIVNRIRVAGETENTMKIGYLNGVMNDYRVAITNGISVDPKQLTQTYNSIDQLHISQSEKALMKDSFKNMINIAQYANQMKGMRQSDMDAMMQKARAESLAGKPGDPAFNMERRQQDLQMLESFYKQEIQRRGKDGASAALDAVPGLRQLKAQAADGSPDATQSYVSQSMAVQRSLGIAQPKAVTIREASEIGTRIKASTSPEMLVQNISQLKQQYGPYTQDVLAQAVEKSDEYKMLAFVSDETQAARVAENILNRPQLEAQLKSLPQAAAEQIKGSAKSVAQKSIAPYAAALNKAYPDGSAGGMIASMTKQVEAEAIKTLLVNDTNAGDLYRKSSTVLTDSFNFINSGAGAVVIPKNVRGVPVDKDRVKSFMEHTVTPEGLQALDVKMPEGLTPEQRQEKAKRFSEVARWIPSPELDGLTLIIGGQATDSKGKPIFIPLSDVERKMKEMNIKTGWFN